MYTIGIDYGTNSVRALLVDIDTGEEIASSAHEYDSGNKGVILDPANPLLARHHPRDYLQGLEVTVRSILENAKKTSGILREQVIGIGIDTTGSTPIPVDSHGKPLAFTDHFSNNLDAFAWLWKDHTSTAEAEEITAKAGKLRPQYLGKVGGVYSSEWLWSKLLRCRRNSPELFAAAFSWVEMCDWVPAVLSGNTYPAQLKRGICAAGHKAFYNPEWNGWPDQGFLAALDPELARIAATFTSKASIIGEVAGRLCAEWSNRLGLPPGIPISVGGFDAHLGAVGCGIEQGVLVKNIGTSTCDMMISDMATPLFDIPGLAGVVPHSIVPGFYGLEAGQSAVGDIFNWYINTAMPSDSMSYSEMEQKASLLKPGESGLLALDWHNGNRTILMDQRLSGLLMGMTLQTLPHEMYRAYIEATAFGSRVIVEQFEAYGCKIKRVVNCGGIAFKSPLVMQIYADVMGKTMEISRSSQTAALGSAIAASVAAGAKVGGYDSFAEAMKKMCGISSVKYVPNPENIETYTELYSLYHELHEAFGRGKSRTPLDKCMKSLITIRDKVRMD